RHPRQAIMRRPGATWPVPGLDLRHARGIDAENRGQEAVHAARKLCAGDELTAIGLQTAPAVVDRHAGGERDQAVRHPRRQHAARKRLLATAPPPAHGITACLEPGEQRPDVAWVVLAVAVERDGHLATC